MNFVKLNSHATYKFKLKFVKVIIYKICINKIKTLKIKIVDVQQR